MEIFLLVALQIYVHQVEYAKVVARPEPDQTSGPLPDVRYVGGQWCVAEHVALNEAYMVEELREQAAAEARKYATLTRRGITGEAAAPIAKVRPVPVR